MITSISQFRLPRYREIPSVGLYLEQTIKYINECLGPLQVTITPSMVSNYVKLGYIRRPVKKQYYADQIACLIFAVLAKQVLSMENITVLFDLQEQTFSMDMAYNFFCSELEEMLAYLFNERNEPPLPCEEDPPAKRTLRSVVTAIAHIIYLSRCFEELKQGEKPEKV